LYLSVTPQNSSNIILEHYYTTLPLKQAHTKKQQRAAQKSKWKHQLNHLDESNGTTSHPSNIITTHASKHMRIKVCAHMLLLPTSETPSNSRTCGGGKTCEVYENLSKQTVSTMLFKSQNIYTSIKEAL
jgi:hypothetical protein